MQRITLLVLSITLLPLVGCDPSSPADQAAPAANATAPAEQAAENNAASDVTIQLLNYDETMKLIQSQTGKVVVVDIWNTSCGPCIKEFPGLVALHKKYGSEKVACVSLSLDYFGGSQKPEEVKGPVLAFLQKQGATFQNIMATEDSDTMLTKLDLAAPPVVRVYDQQGMLIKQFEDETGVGSFTYQDDIEPLVASLLK